VFFVFLALGISLALFITIVADASHWPNFALGKGRLLVYQFSKEGKSFSFALGPVFFLLCLMGGFFNCFLLGIFKN